MLYQLSYWVICGRDGWNRTSDAGVKVPCLNRLATPLCDKKWEAGADFVAPAIRDYGVGNGTRTHDLRNHNPTR